MLVAAHGACQGGVQRVGASNLRGAGFHADVVNGDALGDVRGNCPLPSRMHTTQAQVTIEDDDGPGFLSFEDQEVRVAESKKEVR